MMENENKETVLGIEENFEAALCYAGSWITGIIFLLMEKDNEFVRFHAMQSLITFLGLFIIGIIAGIIPVLGVLISLLITPVGLVLWLFLMYKAYNEEYYKLPYVGDFAQEQLGKMNKEREE